MRFRVGVIAIAAGIFMFWTVSSATGNLFYAILAEAVYVLVGFIAYKVFPWSDDASGFLPTTDGNSPDHCVIDSGGDSGDGCD